MAVTFNHFHFKSPDPVKTARWYVDHLGAKIVSESMRDGSAFVQMDLHGLPAYVTGLFSAQDKGRQRFGLEHIALTTTTYDAEYAKLKAGGSTLLEERGEVIGRRTSWWQGPEGMQLELVEKA
jgi:catechol 2,3-dioxygenase-like lactoylglutathione lyase family enzyme